MELGAIRVERKPLEAFFDLWNGLRRHYRVAALSLCWQDSQNVE